MAVTKTGTLSDQSGQKPCRRQRRKSRFKPDAFLEIQGISSRRDSVRTARRFNAGYAFPTSQVPRGRLKIRCRIAGFNRRRSATVPPGPVAATWESRRVKNISKRRAETNRPAPTGWGQPVPTTPETRWTFGVGCSMFRNLHFQTSRRLLPLPKGEGRGQGEGNLKSFQRLRFPQHDIPKSVSIPKTWEAS